MYADYAEFSEYGKVLRAPSSENVELFRCNEACFWRIAEVPVFDRQLLSMSLHDNTPEAFFPVEGVTALAVANKPDFSDCKIFRLDRPVIIRAGVWHGLFAETEVSRIVVVEDSEVHLDKKPYPQEA